MIIRGRWLLRPDQPTADQATIENAAVAVRDGRIVAVGRWPLAVLADRGGLADADPAAAETEPVRDLGDAVLMPGLVNAHTHLELSGLGGQEPRPEKFTRWLAQIIKAGRARTAAQYAETVQAGLAESWRSGVTALANISYDGRCGPALAASALGTINFTEVFGHSEKQFAPRLAGAIDAGEALAAAVASQPSAVAPLAINDYSITDTCNSPSTAVARCRPGLSPHAPYSAGVAAYLATARAAASRGWPLTTHLHETLAEIELQKSGRGEFSRWLMLRAALVLGGFKPSGASPIRTLAEAGFFNQPVLVAHGNYLDDAEIEILRRSGSTVAFCPRSHDYFGHRDHPYRRLLSAGVPVALGTDSLASSPSLSVLDEMRFLRERDPALPGETLLRMATAAGSDALGLHGCTGRLAVGEEADLIALRPGGAAATNDPYAILFDPRTIVANLWIGGNEVELAAAQ